MLFERGVRTSMYMRYYGNEREFYFTLDCCRSGNKRSFRKNDSIYTNCPFTVSFERKSRLFNG